MVAGLVSSARSGRIVAVGHRQNMGTFLLSLACSGCKRVCA